MSRQVLGTPKVERMVGPSKRGPLGYHVTGGE